MVAVTTGTATKTMLQLATPSNRQCQIISWGYSLSGLPASGSGTIELISTNAAATVTAAVPAGLQPLDPNAPPSTMNLGTGATGYSATVEGTPTIVRVHDTDQISSTAGATLIDADYQFVYDERPIAAVSSFLRVRATFTAAVNMLCWLTWDE